MAAAVGDRVELEISKVVHGGFGLARHDGFVVFVAGTLPGERVSAEISRIAKSHAFAHALAITEPSPHRVPHIWPEADVSRPVTERAGGADFGHIDLDYQRVVKSEIISDALLRVGHADPGVCGSIPVRALAGEPNGSGYRTRVTVHVDANGRVGPYAEGTHTVVPVQTLPLATPEINALGAHRSTWPDKRSLRLIHPSTGDARIVDSSLPPAGMIETVSGMNFVLDDRVFWQVHSHAPSALAEVVTRLIEAHGPDPKAEHWDLYGGVGLFARVLTHHFGEDSRVVSVESDRDASGYARENLSGFPHAKALSMETLRYLRSLEREAKASSRGSLGCVVLDPPRQGAGREVVNLISAQNPQVVIYVACDPMALARDVATFQSLGFHLAFVDALDLFPHTHHVEVVAAFQR